MPELSHSAISRKPHLMLRRSVAHLAAKCLRLENRVHTASARADGFANADAEARSPDCCCPSHRPRVATALAQIEIGAKFGYFPCMRWPLALSRIAPNYSALQSRCRLGGSAQHDDEVSALKTELARLRGALHICAVLARVCYWRASAAALVDAGAKQRKLRAKSVRSPQHPMPRPLPMPSPRRRHTRGSCCCGSFACAQTALALQLGNSGGTPPSKGRSSSPSASPVASVSGASAAEVQALRAFKASTEMQLSEVINLCFFPIGLIVSTTALSNAGACSAVL